jgi:transposase-like protein
LTKSPTHDRIRYNLKRGSEQHERPTKRKLKKFKKGIDKKALIPYNNKCKEQITNQIKKWRNEL